MPRPSIDESLVAEIRRIHRETQGESAGSFQEALDTVVQLALEQTGMDNRASEDSQGWYPGKYAEKVVDRLVGRSGSSRNAAPSSTDGRTGSFLPDRSPENTIVFKSYLGEERTLTVPEAEANALGLDDDDLLQIYAYELEPEARNQSNE